MNSIKGKRQADREGYVQQPPDYDEMDYQTRPQQSQPFPEPRTRNGTEMNLDVAPPRRIRNLFSGNFTNRIFTFAMSIAAIVLASILVRREGNDFRMSQKMIIPYPIIIFLAASVSAASWYRRDPFRPKLMGLILVVDLAILGLSIATHVELRSNTTPPPIDDMMYARRGLLGLTVAIPVVTVIICLRSIFQLSAWAQDALPGPYTPLGVWFWGRSI